MGKISAMYDVFWGKDILMGRRVGGSMNDFETEKELDEKTVVRQFTLGDAKRPCVAFSFFWGGTSILWQGRYGQIGQMSEIQNLSQRT